MACQYSFVALDQARTAIFLTIWRKIILLIPLIFILPLLWNDSVTGVFQHFGHSQQFKLYEVENGKVVEGNIVDTNGHGHGALARLLSDCHADILICGGIGAGAQFTRLKTMFFVIISPPCLSTDDTASASYDTAS